MKGNIDKETIDQGRKNIGHYIREARLKKKLTTEELAERMGLSKSTVEAVENGKFEFKIDLLTAFAHHLGITITFCS